MVPNYNNIFDLDRIFFPINKQYKNDIDFKSTLNPMSKINIYTDKNNDYYIECYLPGLSKSDIDIDINKNKLTISSKYEEKLNEDRKYIQRHFKNMPFEKILNFPPEFNLESVTAEYESGILTIKIPQYKQKEYNSKKINIQ